jgi:predicted helicase
MKEHNKQIAQELLEVLMNRKEHLEELEKDNKNLKISRDFYKSRCELLEKVQKYMRDPERTIVCDILANNALLPDPKGERYGQDLLPLVKTSFFPKDLEDLFKK